MMSLLAASVKQKNLPQQVLRWQSMVESECSAQGVPELVPYVLGLLWWKVEGILKRHLILCNPVNHKGGNEYN